MAADGLKGRVRAAWQNTLLICAKCSRRLDGGFGPKGRTPLAKALRKHLGLKKGRKASLGIVEVKCLGVCPRGAVTVVNGAAPGEWLLVRAGAEMEAVETGLELAESAS
jgi:predicted metal-binding protein